jgi:hypothetical protein
MLIRLMTKNPFSLFRQVDIIHLSLGTLTTSLQFQKEHTKQTEELDHWLILQLTRVLKKDLFLVMRSEERLPQKHI